MSYMTPGRPRSGATLEVWKLADAITAETGRMARRKEVIERFVAEGGNANTASTQYYYWKSAQEEGGGEGGAPEPGAQGADTCGVMRLEVAPDGGMRLPPALMQALGIPHGGVLSARMEDGELRLAEPLQALRNVQEMLRPLRERLQSEGRSLSEELIAERRAEAEREAGRG